MPDSKMRLIASLKRADKIPISMYSAYEKGCKREASQLLEGVFIHSDTDDEMELSPFELLENTLQLLKSRIKSRENADSFKHT
ncbi:Fanconi anemia group A protein homolog, partial [Ruditapes philippinarum]|uniref:Fanconi anemia group A protein homolog n=1 Tax=Ruditapes philippinarum TaxID=129788 RepID=UPI00295BC518